MKITSLSVSGFRSLKNIHIEAFGDQVIFFGDNDSGKSNILAFLEVFFARKYREELTEVAFSDGVPEGNRLERAPTGFWQGQVHGFSDNFFRGQREPIIYNVTIEMETGEITNAVEFPKEFRQFLIENDPISLQLQGEFRRVDPDIAEMYLLQAFLGDREFYNEQHSDFERFGPGFEDVDETEREEVFEKVMRKLDDAFLRIPPNRFLDAEIEIPRNGDGVELDAASFKNWLFRTSLNKDDEEIYAQLREQFFSEPFNGGEISIGRIDDEGLELFVKDQWSVKLPIGRKGSGKQQILIILAYITQSRARFIGIEELEINLSPLSIQSVMKTLGNLLKDDESLFDQLFLTTHSPKVAAIKENTERIFIHLNEQGETEVLPADDRRVNSFYWPERD